MTQVIWKIDLQCLEYVSFLFLLFCWFMLFETLEFKSLLFFSPRLHVPDWHIDLKVPLVSAILLEV